MWLQENKAISLVVDLSNRLHLSIMHLLIASGQRMHSLSRSCGEMQNRAQMIYFSVFIYAEMSDIVGSGLYGRPTSP